MKKTKNIQILITLVAGFLPMLFMYLDLKIESMPILFFISLALFYSVNAYLRRSDRQDIDLQKAKINFNCAIYCGSLILFYIIGLVVVG